MNAISPNLPRLSNDLLYAIEQQGGIAGVELPTFDRSKLKAGIVHIGPGNFPFAHIVAKTNELMQSGDQEALNYGVVAVSLNSAKRPQQLAEQDGLFTLAEQDAEGNNRMTVIGAVMKALYGPDNAQTVVDQIASADTRIVSLTITPQSHQSYMDAQGNLNFNHPDIASDLNPANQPRTIFGYIARGIEARATAGFPPLTIMNLDNMEHNGDVFGAMVRQFTLAYNPVVKSHLDGYAFPNSMVDRIVPRTVEAHTEQVAQKAHFYDASVVPAEPMPKNGSWVIEDHFANGRPAWAEAGLAQVVDEVLPYEKLKLRTLNAAHLLMAVLGDLSGMKFIHETMEDQTIRAATTVLMEKESGPTLDPVPGFDVPAYRAEIISRFVNPNVEDTTARVARDAPLKVVLDIAREQIEAGGSYELLALTTAAWIRRFQVEENELGGAIVPEHPDLAELKSLAAQAGNDPAVMFTNKKIFGNMGNYPDFVDTVKAYMDGIDTMGVAFTTQTAVGLSEQAFARSMRPDGVPGAAHVNPGSNGPRDGVA